MLTKALRSSLQYESARGGDTCTQSTHIQNTHMDRMRQSQPEETCVCFDIAPIQGECVCVSEGREKGVYGDEQRGEEHKGDKKDE